MNVLKKIWEEIEKEQNSYEADHAWNYSKGLEYAKEIICSHMDEISTLKKKAVWEMDVMHHESYDLGRNVGWNECLETIGYIENDGWIPTQVRLPEENNKLRYDMQLVTLEDGEVCLGVYNNQENKWYTRRQEGEEWYTNKRNVVAWQPLPEAHHPKQAPAAEHIMSRFTRVE